MRPEAYIGITGFVARKEVDEVFAALTKDTNRLVMVGVLVSDKTLAGEKNKWPQRYPKPDVLSTIFRSYRNALNLIHFNTKEPNRLLYSMSMAQDLAGFDCHGFQLNIAW